jgi:hypothetical protein
LAGVWLVQVHRQPTVEFSGACVLVDEILRYNAHQQQHKLFPDTDKKQRKQWNETYKKFICKINKTFFSCFFIKDVLLFFVILPQT